MIHVLSDGSWDVMCMWETKNRTGKVGRRNKILRKQEEGFSWTGEFTENIILVMQKKMKA